jgi:hypothetical protein
VLYLTGVVRPDMPAMLQPGMGNRPPAGQPWAADNGRFSKPQTYSDESYLGWLDKRSPDAERCLFATAPDVVGDAAATLEFSLPMLPRIRAAGYRPALVAQDGLEALPVPWDAFDVLFIGGSTAWKLSEACFSLIAEAKRRGKWVHMGRVNSLRRLKIAKSVGCDSVDGTFLRFRQRAGEGIGETRIRAWLADLENRPFVWDAES